jgi:drug/metabolite transporter (DMT)-like permease
LVGRAHSLKPHLALVAVQIFFGTWPIIGKIVLRVLPSTGLVALRVVGGALALVILQRTTSRPRITRRSDYARIALYSLLGVVINQFLYTKGLALSTVINATLLTTTIPIATVFVSMLLGYERPAARVLAGIAVAAGGVIYLVNPAHADFSHAHMLGNLLLILNTLFYGAYIAISQDVIRRYGALTVITWVFIFGCVAAAPLGGYYLAQTPLTNVSLSVWLGVLYIILVPTVGAYYLNAWALGRVAPSTVAIYIYLQPLIAFTIAPYALGEQLNSRTWIAALLIFAGVALVTLASRSRAAEEVSERPEALGH